LTHLGITEAWSLAAAWYKNFRTCGASGNLLATQNLWLPVANSINNYTKKGSFYRESITGADHRPFYKKFQLVFFDLKSAGYQAPSPKYVSVCVSM
jgi:hypothetical protein